MINTSACGNGSRKKSAGLKLQPRLKPEGAHVFLVDGSDRGQIECRAIQMLVRQSHLYRNTTLRRAHIHEGLVGFPGKFAAMARAEAMLTPVIALRKPRRRSGNGIERANIRRHS